MSNWELGWRMEATVHITASLKKNTPIELTKQYKVPAPPPLTLIRTTDNTMPRRKKEAKEEDEEYDESDGSDESVANEKEEAEEAEEAEESNEEAPVPDAPPSGSQRKKKRRRNNYEATVTDLLPSHERKTEFGGYAHTNNSKQKISNANRGNTPWNKGKQRSSSDKAKIKAGVQARNRAIKLEKLRRLGMTEEEYDQKKKEIKYLRERVRRTKLANDRHAAGQAQKKLQEALDATTEKAPGKMVINKLHDKADQEVVKTQKDKKLFITEVSWTAATTWEEGVSYDKCCPTGGPGGLICCQACAKLYSSYLDTTVKDLEIQRTHKIGSEVKEILGYLEKEKTDLDRVAAVARRKAPPIARRIKNTEASRQPARRAYASKQSREDSMEWNLTSTIDIGPSDLAMQIASV